MDTTVFPQACVGVVRELAQELFGRPGFVLDTICPAVKELKKDRDDARKTVSKLNCDYYDALLEVSSLKAALSAAEVARDAVQAERDQLTEEAIELHKQLSERLAEVERLKSELAWVTETELGLTKQNQKLNCAKLQVVYDALAEHCQTAKHPSPLLLEQLQSLYRLLEDPA